MKNRKFETVTENTEENITDKVNTQNENENEKEKIKADINDVMASFEKNKSSFETDQQKVNVSQNANSETVKPFFTPDFATKFVLRLGNFALTHLNLILLNMFSKVKVDFDELSLTKEELDELNDYAEPIANKILLLLPDWAIMLLHVEFIYVDKFNSIVRKKKEGKNKEDSFNKVIN